MKLSKAKFKNGVWIMPCAGYDVRICKSNFIFVQILDGEKIAFQKKAHSEAEKNRFFVDIMTVLLVLKESRCQEDFFEKIQFDFCGVGRACRNLTIHTDELQLLARRLPCEA